MKTRKAICALTVALIAGATGCGVHGGIGRLRDRSDTGVVAKNTEITPQELQLSQVEEQVLSFMDAQDYTSAEALVDQELGNAGHGCFMALEKAEVLAQRDADADAEAMYMQVLHGAYGQWSPDSDELKEPFDLAVELGRTADVDEVATDIIANQASVFGEDGSTLQTPTTGSGAAQREAFACLALALDASFNQDQEGRLDYCLQAQTILPGNTIVLVQLAWAYQCRRQTGDGAEARALLSQAYSQEQAGSAIRADIQDEAYLWRLGPTARLTPTCRPEA